MDGFSQVALEESEVSHPMQTPPYFNQPPMMAPRLQPGDPGPLFLERVNSPWAISSLIFGLGFFFFPLLTGILAVICGHLALSEINGQPAKFKGTGFAVAGLILGYGQVVVAVAIILIAGFTLNNLFHIGL